MNILVSGTSGLIGSALVPSLETGGHRVIKLIRTRPRVGDSAAWWEPASGEIDLGQTPPLDAVVHLAGETIAQRWTAKAKSRIRDSRVAGARFLCEAMATLRTSPRVMVCASATGYYGSRGDEWLEEQSLAGTGFLAEVCRQWEAATRPAMEKGIRVVNLRIGIVLSPNGGALAKLLPAFRLGLGGRLGNGRQYWSWIALPDLLRVIEHALITEDLSGPVNAVAPRPVTNMEFTRTLGTVLRRPTCLRLPAVLVKALFGEMGVEALLGGARVRCARLDQTGFAFQFTDLETTLRQLLAK